MYVETRTAIRRTLERARHLTRGALRAGNRSLALGALLLLTASSASVIATANTAPVFTSLTLSKAIVYEGETVTLTGAFTDPDVGDSHTLLIYWNGDDSDDKQKVQLPAGQHDFQVSFMPPDALPLSKLKVVLYDHQLPPGTNDNTTGGLLSDTNFIPFQILDAKAQFIASSIRVTKDDGSSVRADTSVQVTIEGDLAPPESREEVKVNASWNGAGATPVDCVFPPRTAGRHFRCEHTYTAPSTIKGYPVTLRVKDDEGNLVSHQLTVRIP